MRPIYFNQPLRCYLILGSCLLTLPSSDTQMPLTHEPNVEPQQTKTATKAKQNPYSTNWFVPSPLGQSANFPSPIGQEEASFLEQYLKNFQLQSQPPIAQNEPINLSKINARSSSIGAQIEPKQRASQPSPSHNLVAPSNTLVRPSIPLKTHQPETGDLQWRQETSQQTNIESRSDTSGLTRKGKVDDVSHLMKWNKLNNILPAKHNLLKQQASALAHHKTLFLDSITQNCVTRSTPRTSTCEDHLVKRLSQDATEGRTVIDVGRRVCCALFWHKDCINRIVVETCPDSSPAAADFLIGSSRKLDLTLSCQIYNRDGCNGAHTTTSPGPISKLFNLIGIVVITCYMMS